MSPVAYIHTYISAGTSAPAIAVHAAGKRERETGRKMCQFSFSFWKREKGTEIEFLREVFRADNSITE